MKNIVRFLIPFGVMDARRVNHTKMLEAERNRFHQERRARIAKAATERKAESVTKVPEYDELINFLISRGLPAEHVKDGSIPAASLNFIVAELVDALPEKPPGGYRGLHVGNFIGVSLVTVTGALAALDDSSVVVSIDPNLTHRGIDHPQDHVLAMLSRFNLQKNSLVIAGYSSSKSISNDGVSFAGYDPATAFASESACENSLASLARFAGGKFHLALVDGNHEGEYVARELEALAPLLAEGAVLIMDDVNEAWDEIASLFTSLDRYGFESRSTDGRVGLAIFKGLKS